jgi:hypothetical protein
MKISNFKRADINLFISGYIYVINFYHKKFCYKFMITLKHSFTKIEKWISKWVLRFSLKKATMKIICWSTLNSSPKELSNEEKKKYPALKYSSHQQKYGE